MPRKSSHKFIEALLALSLLAAVAIGGWFWQRYEAFADAPIALSAEERILVVESGDGFQDILDKLRALGVEEGHDLEWKALAQEMGVVSRLQVGDYTIRHGITPAELLRKLERGDVIHYRFTLVEGWNLRDLRKALAADPAAKETWGDITAVARRDWIQWVTSGKKAETRVKRIASGCDMLASGKRRACCFDRSGMYSRGRLGPPDAAQ